jgi:hypothetical protein
MDEIRFGVITYTTDSAFHGDLFQMAGVMVRQTNINGFAVQMPAMLGNPLAYFSQ